MRIADTTLYMMTLRTTSTLRISSDASIHDTDL